MGIIDWINTNNGVIISVATVVLVGITGYYAYLTRRMLKAGNTPEIAVSLRPHEAYVHCVMLSIENIGTGAARNIKFRTDLSFKPDGERALEEAAFLKNGIDYLGPGQKIEHFLVSVIGKLDELKKTPLEFNVTYTDSVKQKENYEHTFCLDFGEDEGLATIGKSPLFEIAEATKGIQKDVRHLTTGFHKPIVRTEPMSEYRLMESVTPTIKRLVKFSNEIQREILEEVDIVIDKREQELQQKKYDSDTATSENTP